MATTKAFTALFNDVGVAASGITTASVTLDDGYGAVLHVKITNGTAPTLPMYCEIYTSGDGTEWYKKATVRAGVTASTDFEWGEIPIDIGTEYVQVVGTGNTGQTCTINVDISEVTAI
jgi:hypothetical protein